MADRETRRIRHEEYEVLREERSGAGHKIREEEVVGGETSGAGHQAGEIEDVSNETRD